MSNDHQDFMRTIIENPDDDACRLAFADWLEENGEPERAEFCRVQIAIGDETHSYCSPDYCVMTQAPCKVVALRRRERELLGGNLWQFTEDIPGKPSDMKFARGFVESITCEWQFWLTHHAAITAATPLRDVHFTDVVRIEATTDEFHTQLTVEFLRGESKTYTFKSGGDPEIQAVLRRVFGGKITFHLPETERPYPPLPDGVTPEEAARINAIRQRRRDPASPFQPR